MNNRRWNRIDELSPQQEVELTSLVNSTPGMTRYGHRARTAVMLPLDIAREVAEYADFAKISISQAIIELLKRQIDSAET